ncbi:MAG: RIP metalloprotease RseP [Betaproteobacteria bacterium HGW-Betaproteobacteria-11]|nr:MAG: RIP metalloprotease RseP [Betaproteobacteria bacterium HGW-Betaproteobacteria-11]
MNPAMLIGYLGAFILALGILVVVHEMGHYLMARACGVKVLRFAFGFGRTLCSWRIGKDQTEWAIAAFPLGGYVKMADEREGTVAAEDLPRAFNRQPLGRRALIVVAGPAANLLLAVVLYWLLFMAGMNELKPRLGAPPAGSPAAVAGVPVGALVRAVNDKPILSWQDLRWEVMRQAMDAVPLRVDVLTEEGTAASFAIDNLGIPLAAIEKDPLGPLGLVLYRPPMPAVIGQVMPGSAAAEAGLRSGDRVLAVDGRPIREWAELSALIRTAGERSLLFDIERTGQRMQLSARPRIGEEGGVRVARLGVMVHTDGSEAAGMMTVVRYGPLEAAWRALAKTWDTAIISLRMMGRMVSGDLSWKNLSGPVTIADYAGQSAQLGLATYLSFLALISISLGVLNLLPVPILDGGHLLYYLAEFIKGGPLSERVLEIGQQIGLALLALLMAFAFYNDLTRLISG